MFKFTNTLITFTALFVVCLLVPVYARAQCVTPPSGMTNWWPADNTTFDIVGGEHGTLVGGATYGIGEVEQAFSLNGTTDFVRVPNDPNAAFNFDGSFTIDAWIYLDTYPPEFAPIVSKWNDIGVDQRGYFLAVDTQFTGVPRLRFDVSSDGVFGSSHSSIMLSAAAPPLNTWTHVAGVFDVTAHTLTVYINGQANNGPSPFITPTISAPFVNSEPVLIGAGDLGGNERDFFDGRIDEVELFGRALAPSEIQSIFDAGSSGKTAPLVIDIKPGDGPNSINLKSKGNVPVAILSTETFDATTMNIGSISLAGAPVITKNNGTFQASFDDVNSDGRLDLVLHFSTQSLNLTSSSTRATLTGSTNGGRCVAGTDSVNIVH